MKNIVDKINNYKNIISLKQEKEKTFLGKTSKLLFGRFYFFMYEVLPIIIVGSVGLSMTFLYIMSSKLIAITWVVLTVLMFIGLEISQKQYFLIEEMSEEEKVDLLAKILKFGKENPKNKNIFQKLSKLIDKPLPKTWWREVMDMINVEESVERKDKKYLLEKINDIDLFEEKKKLDERVLDERVEIKIENIKRDII